MPLMASTVQVLERTPIEDRNGLVYTDKNDNPMNHENWNKKHTKKTLKELGITKNYTPYSFRKFFASYNLNINQVPRNIVASWMGHKDVTTTLKYYDKVLEGTNNDYRMDDLTVKEMPSSPSGHPSVTPLPLAEALSQVVNDSGVIKINDNGRVVWDKVGT